MTSYKNKTEEILFDTFAQHGKDFEKYTLPIITDYMDLCPDCGRWFECMPIIQEGIIVKKPVSLRACLLHDNPTKIVRQASFLVYYTNIILLDVPHADKDKIKERYNAMWHPVFRKWCIDENNPRKNEILNKYKNPRVYLNVKYQEKDKAKEFGAKWDAEKKKWFVMSNNSKLTEILQIFTKEE